MTTVLEVRISDKNDDAEEKAFGAVSRSSGDLEMVRDGTDQTIGLRFNGLDIPPGAVITSAYLQFQADETQSGATSLEIRAQAADNAAGFSTANFDISSRATTASSTLWEPPAWTAGDAGLDQRTSDLAAVMQEVVDRAGWTANNSMVFVITGSGKRVAESFNGNAAAAPLLHIEYVLDPSLVNNPPTDFTLTGATVAEDAALGAVIGTLSGVIDTDAGDTHSFSLVDDAGGRFQIVGDQLQVADPTLLDFEGAASHDVTVRVTDDGSPTGSFDKVFTITVTDVNEAPVVTTPIADTTVEQATALNLSVIANFADDDTSHGDSLTYAATLSDGSALPAWLTFDAAMGTFSGTPGAGDLGILDVTVTATDAFGGLAAADTFQLTVSDQPPPPPPTTSIDAWISAAENDAEESDTGSVSIAGGDLELIRDGASNQTVGLRFDGLDIPPGAVITAAYIQFLADESDTGTTTLEFRAEAADNALAFTTNAFDISSRATTTASVGWQPPDWIRGDSGLDQQTPDLTALVQEVVDRAGWAANNALAIIVTGSGQRVADAYNGNLASSAQLHIEFVSDPSLINQAPTDFTLTGATVAEDATLATVVGTLGNVTDPNGDDTHTFSLIDSSGGRFQIVGDQLRLADPSLLDFEGAASHNVTVRVTDNGSPAASFDKTFAIAVTDVNEAPTDFAISGSQIAEGSAIGTVVGTFGGVIDPDTGDSHSFTLVDSAGGAFALVGTELRVADPSLLDTAVATSLDVIVRVTDGGTPGLTFDKTFTVLVTGINNAPADFALSGTTVVENAALGTVIGTLGGVVDPDAIDTHSFSLDDDAGGRFQIVGNELRVANASLIDFETAASHDVIVRVTDSGSPPLSTTKTFTIAVTDANDAPNDVTLTGATVAENAVLGAVVGTLSGVVDQDGGDTHTLSLIESAGGRFQIVGNQLQVADPSLLDFEGAASHDVVVRVTDDGIPNASFDKTFTITVTDVNEAPVVITPIADATVNEGSAFNLAAANNFADDDTSHGDSLTYSATLSDGSALPAWLAIDATTGALAGTPGAGDLGVLDITVTATDTFGGFAASDTFQLTVSDQPPPAPVSLDAWISAAENDAEESDTGAVSISGGDLELIRDGASNQTVGLRFDGLDIPSGAVITAAYIQFLADESDTGTTTLEFRAEAADNALAFTTAAFDVSSRATTTASVGWQPLAWIRGDAGPDQQTPDLTALVQEVIDRAGWAANNALAFIVTGSGQRVADAYNGNLASSAQLHIEYVVDPSLVNQAPTDFTLTGATVAEDAALATAVGTLGGVIDPNGGDTHTFSLIDDAGGRFQVVGNQLQVADPSLLDFEGAASHDVTVRVTDSGSPTGNFDKTFAIAVTDVNEAPVVTTPIADSTAVQDTAFSLSAAANFADDDTSHGDSLTYSATLLDGGALPAWLAIDPTTGALTGTPGAGDLGILDVTVTATDAFGGLAASDTFRLTVSDQAPPDLTPTVLDIRIISNIDDAEESASGQVSSSSGDLEFVSDGTDQTVGMRFNGLDIPPGAVITAAYLQFQADESQSGATTLEIRAEDADNAAVFSSSSFDITSRATTAASATWAPAAWTKGDAGPDQQTPDLSALVQEVVDRGGWAANNSMAFIVSGSGKRVAESHNGNAAAAPLLHIEYVFDPSSVNQSPTDFTLTGGSVAEDAVLGAVVGTLGNVTDPDSGDTHTFSLLDDAGGRFTVVGNELRVADPSLLDFETTTSHDVVVQVTDSGSPPRSLNKTFTVTVTDANDAPTSVALTGGTVVEGAAIGTVAGILGSVVDPDIGDTHTFSLFDDAGGRFILVGNEIQVADPTLLDFEAAASHDVVVRVTDNGVPAQSLDQTMTIALTDINEAPTDFALSNAQVLEDAAIGAVVGSFGSVVDPDAGDTHTFALLDDAGGRFSLVGNELRVADPSLLDFETTASHDVVVRATDAGTPGLGVTRTFTVAVQNANDAPTNVTLTGNTVAENALAGAVVGTLGGVVDQDTLDTHTFSLFDDAGGRFQIVGDQLQVADPALLDFETMASHDVTVRATDNGSPAQSFDKVFTIAIQDANDAPTTVDDLATADRNVAAIVDVLVNDSDQDGDPLSVGSVGLAAHGSVSINGDGTLTYTPDLDFSGSDSFTYTAIDGNGGSSTATVDMTVIQPQLNFLAIGDSPYDAAQEAALLDVLANKTAGAEFVIHIGDIKAGSTDCSTTLNENVAALLQTSDVPVFIIPGDNEFNDCLNIGHTEAWTLWENTFLNFDQNWAHDINVSYQDVRPENFSFMLGGDKLFIGINLVGGVVADRDEWHARAADDLAWIDQNVDQFANVASSAVIFAHTEPDNAGYASLEDDLAVVLADFAKPVLYLQGDHHQWILDNPAWAATAPNVTRVMLPQTASLDDALTVTVSTDSTDTFTFDHVFT